MKRRDRGRHRPRRLRRHPLPPAKSGIGIADLLEAIVTRIPPPKGDADAPLKAMLVDSWYDPYLGVVILVRVVEGVLKKGQQIKRFMGSTAPCTLVERVGMLSAQARAADRARPGRDRLHHRADQGDFARPRVGDTITDARRPA